MREKLRRSDTLIGRLPLWPLPSDSNSFGSTAGYSAGARMYTTDSLLADLLSFPFDSDTCSVPCLDVCRGGGLAFKANQQELTTCFPNQRALPTLNSQFHILVPHCTICDRN